MHRRCLLGCTHLCLQLIEAFDDLQGWGCAYRSMQTLCSWLFYQQYTSLPVPTHAQIQQALVSIGDKPSSFVGSRDWIGAFEISMCMDHFFGVACKIINIASGSLVRQSSREFATHFEKQGSPIMIGMVNHAHAASTHTCCLSFASSIHVVAPRWWCLGVYHAWYRVVRGYWRCTLPDSRSALYRR
jgi:hypothetical protein